MKKIIASTLGFFAPMLAFAQSATYITTTTNIVKDLIRAAFIILPALALLFFFWELIGYMRATSDEKKRRNQCSSTVYSHSSLFSVRWELFEYFKELQEQTVLSKSKHHKFLQLTSNLPHVFLASYHCKCSINC